MTLRVEKLTKRFGGICALREVDLVVEEGRITGLIGPNGAGKTTLFNCVTGIHRPDAGRVTLGAPAVEITGLPAHDVCRRGIGRTFQNARVFAGMSVLENVMVGTFSRSASGMWDVLRRSPSFLREEKQVRETSRDLLSFVGLAERAGEMAGRLPFGLQRRLEIARALAASPRLLLMDEPAAGMNPQEKEDLLAIIRKVSSAGITVFVIEHDVQLVMRVCDWISVLDSGEKISEGTPEQVRNDPRVIEAYLGAREYVAEG